MSKSELEEAFMFYVDNLDLPKPVREHRFHPVRRWRFDFAWIEKKVAVECEGGIWNRGRHVRGTGFENDCQKYNAASAMGWVVFRVTSGILEKDTLGFFDMLIEALEGKGWTRKAQ